MSCLASSLCSMKKRHDHEGLVEGSLFFKLMFFFCDFLRLFTNLVNIGKRGENMILGFFLRPQKLENRISYW